MIRCQAPPLPPVDLIEAVAPPVPPCHSRTTCLVKEPLLAVKTTLLLRQTNLAPHPSNSAFAFLSLFPPNPPPFFPPSPLSQCFDTNMFLWFFSFAPAPEFLVIRIWAAFKFHGTSEKAGKANSGSGATISLPRAPQIIVRGNCCIPRFVGCFGYSSPSLVFRSPLPHCQNGLANFPFGSGTYWLSCFHNFRGKFASYYVLSHRFPSGRTHRIPVSAHGRAALSMRLVCGIQRLRRRKTKVRGQHSRPLLSAVLMLAG